MLRNKAVILAKIEVIYGTDPTPTAAANAILCELPEYEVLGRKLERNNVKSFFGTRPQVNIGEGQQVSFTTELKASGSLGVAPEIGVLFRGCNMTETVTASTKVDYDPNSNQAGESITIYYYQDNILHKVLGCRGNFSLDLKGGEYGKIKWTFQGIYGGPVDSTIPASPTFSSVLPPRFLSASFAIDTYAAIISALKIDVKNETAKRPDANSATGIKEFFINERAVTGEIDPEVVALATKSFWGLWDTSSQVAFTATVGGTAGNKCTITGPKIMIDSVKYADRDNILTHALPILFIPNTGNDEIKFSFV